MRIILGKPSKMEGDMKVNENDVTIVPHRRSLKQQNLTVVPFDVVNAGNLLLDSGVLIVNQKTGKLKVEHFTPAKLPIEADAIKQEAKA